MHLKAARRAATFSMRMAETRRQKALRHVLKGRTIVAAQRALIASRRSEGKDTADAEDLLSAFERSQAIFEDDLRALETNEPDKAPSADGI
jgi:hypothetical protein